MPSIKLVVPPESDREEPSTLEFPDYPGIAKRYCEMILLDEVPACIYIKQAAQRYLDMLEEASKPDSLFYFSDAWACDFLEFFEKLHLATGGKKGDTFVLQPWQIWVGCAVFGFRRNDPESPNEIGARLVRRVYIEVPRGHGKSVFAAVVGLYCWLHEQENGSHIYIAGPKADQAMLVFNPMRGMIENTPGMQDFYGIKINKSEMRREHDHMAQVRLVSSIADREDGANPHVVIMEELHAQDEALFNVMSSSLAKRVNNLFFSITTAGNRAQGICWNTRKRLISILSKKNIQDSFFGVIFTLDKDEIDDRKKAHDPKNWAKCNPMLGVSITKSGLIEDFEEAKGQSPARMLEFERTRLNIWSDGAGGLISSEAWDTGADKNLDVMSLRGRTAWIGIDLASKNDMCSLAIIIDDPDHMDNVTVHTEHFVPSQSPSFMHSEFGPLYFSWVRDEHLTMTLGAIADYNVIESRIRFWCDVFDVQAIVGDSYQSNQIIASLTDSGLPAMQMQPGVKTVSAPAKDIIAKVGGGFIRHDGNPVMGWMVANVVGYFDKRDNVLPQKESPNSPYRIDGFSALLAANVAREDKMLEVKRRYRSVYEERGLHGGDVGNEQGPDNSQGDHTD